MSKLKIKKGDTVVVIAGDHKGNEGVVSKIIRSNNRVIVEGVNLVTKHVKPSSTNPQGGIQKIEAPIHVSNVSLIDPKSKKATRAGFRENKETGKFERFSKESNELL